MVRIMVLNTTFNNISVISLSNYILRHPGTIYTLNYFSKG